MSGMRGVARKGKMKVIVALKFEETGKRVKTHLFVKESIYLVELLDKITDKFNNKDIYIESVHRKGSWVPMFQKAV
jgi:hypothetical protein